jgi:hypothetical protein
MEEKMVAMKKARHIEADVGVKILHKESDAMSELAKEYANWLHGYAESVADEAFGRGHIWRKPMSFPEFCAMKAKAWQYEREHRD